MVLALLCLMRGAAASLAHFFDPWDAGRPLPCLLYDFSYFDSDGEFFASPEGDELASFFVARRA